MAEEYLTDDEQLEAVKHWFTEYAPWLIGGVLVGAAVFFGIQYFHRYTNDRGLKAAAEFSAMTAALQTNDHEKSRRIAEGLIKDYREFAVCRPGATDPGAARRRRESCWTRPSRR